MVAFGVAVLVSALFAVPLVAVNCSVSHAHPEGEGTLPHLHALCTVLVAAPPLSTATVASTLTVLSVLALGAFVRTPSVRRAWTVRERAPPSTFA